MLAGAAVATAPPPNSSGRRLLALLCAALLAACAHPRQPSRPTAGRDRVAAPRAAEGTREHRGSGPFATLYGLREPPQLDEVGVALLALVNAGARGAGIEPPISDRAANLMAREVCLGLPREGPPAARLVDFALRAHGMIEVPPHLLIAELPTERGEALGPELGQRLASTLRAAAYARVGIAVCRSRDVPGRRRAVLAFTESRARARPFPRGWRVGEERALTFEVHQGYARTRLVVADPRGGIRDQATVLAGGEHRARLRCAVRGVYRVELTGEGPQGAEVLANFPLYCGVSPPQRVRYVVRAAGTGDPRQLEQEIVRLTNEARARVELPPLAAHADLAQVARRHSEEMRDKGFVAHISPSMGGTADRVRRAGIRFLVLRENVARAPSAAEAIDELMNSPAHRGNMLARDVTGIGVGVAVKPGDAGIVLYVTQKFIAPAMAYDPAGAARVVLRTIQRRREASGLPRLTVSPTLNRLAARYVKEIASAGQKRADERLSAALGRAGEEFRRVSGLLLKLSAVEHVAQADEYLAPRATHVGFAITRQAETIVLFVAIAER